MAETFEHEILAIDGLTVTFASKEIHPDAGIAWPESHAIQALGSIDGDDNPIYRHLGGAFFDVEGLTARYTEMLSSVELNDAGKRRYRTTVVFLEPRWLPASVAVGYRWTSAA